MNIYIVTIKFLRKSCTNDDLLSVKHLPKDMRTITGRWIVKAENCIDALHATQEFRGEIIEARTVRLMGKDDGIYCIEYDGKSKYGLLD